MGICEVLTVIFIVCKLNKIGACAHWSWFQCFMPEIIAGVIYLSIFIFFIYMAFKKPNSKRR